MRNERRRNDSFGRRKSLTQERDLLQEWVKTEVRRQRIPKESRKQWASTTSQSPEVLKRRTQSVGFLPPEAIVEGHDRTIENIGTAASMVVPFGPALRVTGRVGKAVINTLFKTQPFNPARRAILKAAGAATAVVATGGKSASVIKAILPKVAHTPLGNPDFTGAVLRYPGHVRGTPVGDAASNWRHWRKVVNQGFPEGRLGNALHILEDATPIVIKKAMAEAVKGTTKIGKEALVRAGKLPPPPPGYGQSFINQQMSRVNRLTSPTGRPMNPARMKSMLESWVKNTQPDFW